MQIIRFLFVSAVGVIVDIAIAYSAIIMLGAPIHIAATISFFVATFVNYVAHQKWTFRSGLENLSVKRIFQYAIVSVVTLSVRVTSILLLSLWSSDRYVIAILVAAAGVSFLVNYTLSRFVFINTVCEMLPNEKSRKHAKF